MNTKQKAFTLAVESVRNAESAKKALNELTSQFDKAVSWETSAVSTACAHAYAASLAGITGAEIAREAGVSEMTVSRYIAGGKVSHQTEDKVTGSKAVSDMGNGYITVSQVKNSENASQYAKAISAGKAAKAGKTNKADKRTDSEIVRSHLEAVTKAIKAGRISLDEVTNIWADLLAELDTQEMEEEMEETEEMIDA
jgi:predicted transcriptional regulator